MGLFRHMGACSAKQRYCKTANVGSGCDGLKFIVELNYSVPKRYIYVRDRWQMASGSGQLPPFCSVTHA